MTREFNTGYDVGDAIVFTFQGELYSGTIFRMEIDKDGRSNTTSVHYWAQVKELQKVAYIHERGRKNLFCVLMKQ